VIILGSAIINHVLLLAAIMIIFLFFGHLPGLAWLYLVPGVLIISTMAFGIGVFLGVLNVFVRDVAQFMSVFMQLWFWFTPIVYLKNVVPHQFQWLLALNPMTPLVGLYQDALLLNQGPQWASLLPTLLVGGVAVLLSFTVFRRASPELVDAL
jgi:lipopolysaccharide transport system permease protein